MSTGLLNKRKSVNFILSGEFLDIAVNIFLGSTRLSPSGPPNNTDLFITNND